LTAAGETSIVARVSRERAIEIAFDGLLVGMLIWQPLRDAAALALLVLLASEPASAEGSRARSVVPSEWRWPIAAFFAANLLAAAASAYPRVSFAYLAFYPLGLLVFLGARRTIAAGGAYRVATVVLAIIVAFGADEMCQYVTGRSFLRPSAPMWGRFQGALVYPSDVSLLALLLPIASVAAFGGSRRKLALGVAVVALVAIAISLSGTRAGFGALVIFGLAAGWIHGRRWLSASIVAVAIVSVVATAGLGYATVARRTLSAATYRAENRAPQWRAAIVLFREAPILGYGPHGFRDVVWARRREPTFRAVQLKYAPYPHDIYLEALAGTGICGFASLAWLLTIGARTLHRNRTSGPPARAALVSLASFAAVGLFDLSLVKDWVQLCFWLPLGIAAGLSAAAIPEATTSPRSDDDDAESTRRARPR
jgi:O-antigen ligase